MRKNITLADIARECGFAKSTVGYALSPQHHDIIPEKTREKITSTAKRLGYISNAIGRSLRENVSRIIGIMLPDPTNYFYATLCLELERMLWQKGYTPFFTFWTDPSDCNSVMKNYEKLLSWNVDGIITCVLKGAIPTELHKPIVFFHPTDLKNNDTVAEDPSILEEGIKILLEKGHRKFALIGTKGQSKRKDAFLKSLKKFGLQKNPEWIILDDGIRTLGKAAMEKLLLGKNRPTAIIGQNDVIAIAAMNEAQRQGIKVPGEMAFMGFDDIEEAAFSNPPLTTFNVSAPEVAKHLVETLFKRIESPDDEITHKIIIPKFIIRASI